MGRSRPTCIIFLLSIVLFCANASAQHTAYTAVRQGDLQLGGGFSYALTRDSGDSYAIQTGYSNEHITGFKLYGNYDFKTHFGIEADVNQLNGKNSVYERTYEIGPRYVLRYDRWDPYVRVMYGRGVFNFPQNIANLAYNIGVVGGGVDYHLSTHINLRADYEYQKWFGFPPHDLTPSILSIGAAYHF